MEGEREVVTRVQRLKGEYMSSLAWFRLAVQMSRADPPRTYLGASAAFPEAESQAWVGAPSSQHSHSTACLSSVGPVPHSLLFALFHFDVLDQLPSPCPCSHGTVGWYSPSQHSSDNCLPFYPKVPLPHLTFSLPCLMCCPGLLAWAFLQDLVAEA